MKRLILSVILACGLFGHGVGDDSYTGSALQTVPKEKQTPLGKYISVSESYALLKQQPNILFIDVRDPVEIGQSGQPAMIDAIVPIQIQTTIFDEELGEFILADNPYFLDEMQEVLGLNGKTKDHKIILICGSGVRSAVAVRALHKGGYTNVWHIPDGYDGDDKVGVNVKNSWKLAGLPWTYDLVHGSQWRLLLPEE